MCLRPEPHSRTSERVPGFPLGGDSHSLNAGRKTAPACLLFFQQSNFHISPHSRAFFLMSPSCNPQGDLSFACPLLFIYTAMILLGTALAPEQDSFFKMLAAFIKGSSRQHSILSFVVHWISNVGAQSNCLSGSIFEASWCETDKFLSKNSTEEFKFGLNKC